MPLCACDSFAIYQPQTLFAGSSFRTRRLNVAGKLKPANGDGDTRGHVGQQGSTIYRIFGTLPILIRYDPKVFHKIIQS
ncbi:MAG: hypothetical protein M0Q13_02015 [Methanothrix sp.]|nr:hypothetical protein [Methanothrix sp.]